ncbi:MAG: hypothetical protein R3D56_05050 [Paracoccaceae bacterium]
MIGIIAAQALLNFRDPGGFDLFVNTPNPARVARLHADPPVGKRTPAFERISLSIKRLFVTSPLGCVGMF